LAKLCCWNAHRETRCRPIATGRKLPTRPIYPLAAQESSNSVQAVNALALEPPATTR
jgi:hypothetical protein